ncbi:MAG: response regulator [Nitrospirales bacterium]
MEEPLVFIVEDEDVLRRGIVKRLTRHHYNVREFDSGEALLSFIGLKKEKPDVLLMDYKMPGMNGLETLEVIQKNIYSVSTIILTAYEGDVNVEAAQKLGVYAVCTKTLEFEGLIQIVNGALADRELQRRDS